MNPLRRQVRRVKVSLRAKRRKLLSLLPKRANCAEIGVWKGDHAERVLKRCKPKMLYLIDPWRHEDRTGAMYSKRQEELDAIHASVVERFDGMPVTVRRMTSEEAAATIPARSLEWVYIDGDHRYDAVKRDLDLYASRVAPGGYLTGDDYGIKGWWDDGVTRAVNEFAASDRCSDFRVIGTQFLIRLRA
jgi:hypothetical protein